jgi:hypothetical protein
MTSSFDCLPKGVDLAVFSFLDIQAIGRCCQVNKKFKQLASENVLWRNLIPKTCGLFTEITQNLMRGVSRDILTFIGEGYRT